MKFSIISDVHVKKPGDSAEELLLRFLSTKDVESSDVIFLLGDIFDLMIGPHSQYLLRFQLFFDKIEKLLNKGVKICYVEGNHDFHIKKLYQAFFKLHAHLDNSNFKMAPFFEFQDNGKKIYLAHGDDIELGNPEYRAFKSLVTSRPVEIFANYLMPHLFIKSLGEFSSEQSRKRNNKRYSSDSDLTPVKEKFRKSVEFFHATNSVEIIVLGHSHVKDHYVSPNGFEYVNNGYAQHTKTYISIINGDVCFKDVN